MVKQEPRQQTIRSVIKRNIGEKIEGVVKVFDPSTLATELREYVVTDKIEDELKKIFDVFTHTSEILRAGSTPRDVMGMWVSGFFGSGKSHFAKVLGYLLQNNKLGDGSGENCIDAFIHHLSDMPRGKDIRLRLGEIKLNTQIRTIAFEIKSRQSLTNPNSIGEIILSEFYRHIGLSENFVVARIERRMAQRGTLGKLEQVYKERFGVEWKSAEGRENLMTVRRRLAQVLPESDPVEYADSDEAKRALEDMFRHEKITAEGLAEELVSWVDGQPAAGGKTKHLVFVIDEMGTFIGDSNDKIGELNSIAEMIGNKGKGKVWLIATSQQDLEKVVDRTNFQPALVGRLNARFELKPHLISDEINKVVSERILKKHPSEEASIRRLYQENEGHIAQLSDLKASRHLGSIDEKTFVASYPFLPHQIRLAQDIFEALSGFRLSGGVRSMISVVMEAIQRLADKPVGAVVSFDQIFDAVENDLLSQEYLGASGIRSIREADERVPGTVLSPGRVLKVLWLLNQITWVPRVPETVAKLLVQGLETEIAPLREQVEQTLRALQAAGYVARDEATGEWKFLNERERTIEQSIQEMIRPGGTRSISVATIRRTSQEICKTDLITRKRLNNFVVTAGRTKIPFSFNVYLDGEAVETGADLEAHFVSPLMPNRKSEVEEIRRQNQAAGTKGKKVWLAASVPDALESRLRRYEALVKVTGDKRFTDDTSKDTQDALAEKRKERDDLRNGLVRDLEKAFLAGTIFYGGQEIELEGASELKQPVENALGSVIPNVYTKFSLADREFDFNKGLKSLLNAPTPALHQAAPALELFDTQGSLQRESALVAQVLEVLGDMADEGLDPQGALLLDAKDNRGFKGFTRPPFGWPEELVRLVLAAGLRAGAIYVEEPTATGVTPRYDYRDSEDFFAKIRTFQKVSFRLAETSLTVDQLKQANKHLIAMGVTGTPESGNAIASAVQKLGQNLQTRLREARLHAGRSFPLPEAMSEAEKYLTEPTTAHDPSKVVTAFLSSVAHWQSLYASLEAFRSFLDANRLADYETSRRLAELAVNHPVTGAHPQRERLEQSLRDMDAIIAGKDVIGRWGDYRTAFEAAGAAYREAYRDTYERVRSETEEALTSIRGGAAYESAPADERDRVLNRVFGAGGACHYPTIQLASHNALLESATRRSLTSLEQALMALPGYRRQVEAELLALAAPPEPPDPGEKVWDWHSTSALVGRRFRTEAEVDEALTQIGDQIKARVRDGFTVVVK
jgi:hypothetical protein